jgi:hypothetical protein
MKKYIEQRLEDLELEVNLIKVKHKLSTLPKMSKVDEYINTSESKATNSGLSTDYIYNHMYSPNLNILSEPDLETAFASPYDEPFNKTDPIDTFNFNLSSVVCDSLLTRDCISDQNQYDQEFMCPLYPHIVGSWDKNQDDTVDEYGFKMNRDDTITNTTEEPITTWGFTSEYDLMDKDFLAWLTSSEVKPLYDKFKQQRYFGQTYK